MGSDMGADVGSALELEGHVYAVARACCLSRGSVRANTMPPREAVSRASRFFSGSAKNSAPVNDLFFSDSPLVKMPISFAIASAVGCVSPVIITTRIPAV